MKLNITKFQWSQLILVSAVHFIADFIAGIIPALLPAFRQAFALRLALGVAIFTVFSLTVNIVQVIIGPLRSEKRKPIFLELGLILGVALCLVGLLPRQASVYPLIIALTIISSVGIAMVHPESLRVVHALKRIPSATSTTIFMAAGFFGFALGSGVGGAIVDRFGLAALYYLIIPPALILIAVRVFRLRMATEKPAQQLKKDSGNIWFWPIFAMAVSACTATMIITAFMSETLTALGFSLSFGGFCLMAFGICSALGSLLLAKIANRFGQVKTIIVALLLGVPLFFVYMFNMDIKLMWLLLALGGTFSPASFPLMVSLARHSHGPNLGHRMGMIVGGVWLVASFALWAVSPIAEKIGTLPVMQATPICYIVSAAIAIFILIKYKTK